MKATIMTLASLVLAGVGLSSCNEISVTPGNTVTTTRSAQGFSHLEVSDGFEVEITRGTAEALRVEAPEGFQPYIKTEVENGTLRIYLQEHVSSSGLSPEKVYLTVTNLEGVTASGGSRITSMDTLRSAAFSIAGSGSSVFTFPLQVSELNCEASGSSELNLSGAAEGIATNFSGSSRLHAFDLATTSATINGSGSSRFEVRVSSALAVSTSGGSETYYKGHPAITQSLSGGSRIIDAN